jgi:hypothetical protein
MGPFLSDIARPLFIIGHSFPMKEKVPGECKRAYRSLLSALASLEEAGVEVTADGLVKVLHGVVERETSSLVDLPAFGYLPSLSSKKLKNRIHWLVRQGFVHLSYDSKLEDYFLALTESGHANVIPLPPKKRERYEKTTIRAIHKGE